MTEKTIFPRILLRLLPLGALMFAPAGGLAAAADTGKDEPRSYAELSLEQLMNVEVTSAAKKPQKLEDAAAAITVITQEDIRHSGMTSVPELLRMVPGLQVSQMDGSTWAIGSRGFNGRWSNKLLVLLDGRTLYTPLFSGVYWDAQDLMLEDIDRIEVIRGPGGTLWGANAVNGVINITTKSAAATRGGLVSAGAGNYERQGAVRYGGEIGENGHFRVYAKSGSQDNFPLATGATAHDQRQIKSAGFRADWALPGGDTVTAQGDAYDGNSDHTDRDVLLSPPSTVPLNFATALNGSNVLLRWKRALSATSEWSLQFYYDTYQRRDVQSGEKRNTYDMDFQYRFLAGKIHDIVWGLGYRRTSDETDNKFLASFSPQNHTDTVVSAFVQDDIALAQDRVHLIVGTKVEHNEHTGTEYQPNLRLLWKMNERQTGWAAVSRAVRTPSRADLSIRINAAAFPGPGGTPTLARLLGNPGLQAENLLAYEAGYRVRPSERLSLDATAFYNEYRNLMTAENLTPFFEPGLPPRFVLPQLFQNKASASSHGLELAGNWQAAEKWRVKAGYAWLKTLIRRDADSLDTLIEDKGKSAPQNQLQLQVNHALNARTDLSASLYYVDRLSSLNVASYTRLDARLAWRPRRDVELSLTGRNLLDRAHMEYVSIEGPSSSEVPRSVFGAVKWRF